jgi:hypothetical protein
MEDLLQQGITAYKAGKRDQARKIFMAVVKQNPDSERAWGWMFNVCNTDKERIYCLNQLLHLNPKNEKAHQLLDQLLESPLSSSAANAQTPIPSEAETKNKQAGFTQTQKFVLLGLGGAVLLLFGVMILSMFTKKNSLVIALSPTTIITTSANMGPVPTQVPLTATPIPTYAYAPTWTPLPSPTSFVVPTLIRPTPVPQQAQSSNPANPPSGNSGSDCASQLDYAAAMHQYYLDQIDYIHAPLINLYQSWIDEAAGNRDAVGMVDAQRKLDNERAQVKAEKSAENKRYKAELARINASC